MKKTFLGSAAALVALLGTASMAQDAVVSAPAPTPSLPKLSITGSTSFHLSFVDQTAKTSGGNASGSGYLFNDYNYYPTAKGQGFGTSLDDSFLDFSATGMTEHGIEYMARFNLSGQTGSATAENNYSTKKRVRQNYVQLRAFAMTLQGGNLWGVETTSVADASTLMRGDGGFGSNWSSRFNEPFTMTGPAGNMVYGAYLAATSNTGTKLSFYLPAVEGLQLAMSFTPNTAHEGDMAMNGTTLVPGRNPAYAFVNGQSYDNWPSQYFDQNHQAYSMTFSRPFGDFSLSLAGSFITVGDTKDYINMPNGAGSPSRAYNKSSGYTIGGTISYEGFDLGGGFYDNKKTGVLLVDSASGRDAGKVWNVGIGHSWGDNAVAIGYLEGERNTGTKNTNMSQTYATSQKAKAQIYSVTADWRLAEGLTVYGDVNYAKMQDPTITDRPNNTQMSETKGTVVLIGTRVNF